MIKIRFVKLSSNAIMPSYQTSGSSGLDLAACLLTSVTIQPQEVALIPTGIAIEIPEGFEAQIRPRSGLALKHLISLPNAPATIDSDYRGEIKIILINHGKKNFVVKHGDRLAQMIIAKTEKIELIEVSKLSSTERGEGGFGHTGV